MNGPDPLEQYEDDELEPAPEAEHDLEPEEDSKPRKKGKAGNG